MNADQYAENAHCSDLIARLEKAEAGSRELDAKISDHFKWWPEGFTRIDFHGRDRRWRKCAGIDERIDCPAFTTSIDAITALIGEKLPGCEYAGGTRGQSWARLRPVAAKSCSARAQTLTLALCAALLRALQAKESEHG